MRAPMKARRFEHDVTAKDGMVASPQIALQAGYPRTVRGGGPLEPCQLNKDTVCGFQRQFFLSSKNGFEMDTGIDSTNIEAI